MLLFGLALMVGGAGVLVGLRNEPELRRLLRAGRARRPAPRRVVGRAGVPASSQEAGRDTDH